MQHLKNITAGNPKTVEQDNIIRYVEKDVTAIRPDGLSVVEVADITANRRADISGNWMFKDGTVIKRIYTAEELQQQAENRKARLLADAESVILPLERAVRLNMATDEERSRLEAWERYSVLVSRVDPANPEWPEMPQ